VTEKQTDAGIAAGQELAHRIALLCRGKSPEITGPALAEIVSRWLIGWHPDLREENFSTWVKLVRDLATINEKMMFGEGGWEAEALRQNKLDKGKMQ